MQLICILCFYLFCQMILIIFIVLPFKFSGKNKFLKSVNFLIKTDIKFKKFISYFSLPNSSFIILVIKVVFQVDFGQYTNKILSGIFLK